MFILHKKLYVVTNTGLWKYSCIENFCLNLNRLEDERFKNVVTFAFFEFV